MDQNNQTQTIPYKSKVAYEIVFLEAIKDVRKQRVVSADEGYVNAIIALKQVLLPLERGKIETYMLDTKDHKDELKALEKEISTITDKELRWKIYINKLKKMSWPIYCNELNKLFKEDKLEDQNFSDTVDKNDLMLLQYDGLFEKIIDVLKEGDWLIKGADVIAGGGGHGLDEG